MSSQLSEEEIYEIARKRVEEKKGFFIHLIVYVVVNIILIIIWAVTDSGDGVPWFVYPLGGWGIGLVCHYFSVTTHRESDKIRSARVEKEAEKIRTEQQ